MKAAIFLCVPFLLAVSCSKEDAPSPLDAKRKIAQQKIDEAQAKRDIGQRKAEQAQEAITVDEWWARNAPKLAEEDRLEMQWEIKRGKQLLNIFKGDNGSKLPYKEFMAAVEQILKRPVEDSPSDEVITKTYADYINWFAYRNEIPPYKAMRYDYVLTSEGLNLLQFDLMLYRLGVSRNQALGRPLDAPQPKSAETLIPIKSGTKKPKQNAEKTKEEQDFLKLCKTVVNDIWKEGSSIDR